MIVSEIENYFAFLDSPNQYHTGFVSDLRGTGLLGTEYSCIFATAPEWLELAARVDGRGCLHVCLNTTFHRGRKQKDIESCRVLCIDIDEPSEKSEDILEYSPDYIVTSSPGKFHYYWRVSSALDLRLWVRIQRALAWRFGGDRNLSQLQHTIRIPGMERITKSGERFTPTRVFGPCGDPIVGKTVALRTFPEIVALFLGLENWIQESEKILTSTNRSVNRQASTGASPRSPEAFQGARNEHNLLLSQVSEETYLHGLEWPAALDYAQRLNSVLLNPEIDSEVERVALDAWEFGIKRFMEKESRITAAEKSNGITVAYTNGHAEESINVNIPPLTSNPKDTPFNYDYSDPLLRENRFTDLGVAARVLQRFGERMIVVGDRFYAFDEGEKVWRLQEGRKPEIQSFVSFAIQDTLHDPLFIRELATNSSTGEVSIVKLKGAQSRFMSARLLGSIVSTIYQSSGVTRGDMSWFDAADSLVYCANGVLDMQDCSMREAGASDYMLCRTGVNWEPDATCEEWLGFLDEVFSENEDSAGMVRFLQEVFGYSLSGSTHEQKIFCHYGSGGNGKSKILGALRQLCGSYGTLVDPDDVVGSGGAFKMKFERFGAKLEGFRVAIIDDIESELEWNESFVKNATGREIRARAEHQRSRVVTNRAKLHFGLNEPPKPQSENSGFLRRLSILPYGRSFRGTAFDSKRIDEMIVRELPGILRWAVEGYQRQSEAGLSYPDETIAAVQEYKDTQFKTSSLVKQRYSSSETEFMFTYEIIEDLKSIGYRGQELTTMKLGNILTRELGVKSEKRWSAEKRNAFKGYKVTRNLEK